MNFTLKNLVLWPKEDGKELRILEFKKNKINVITGDSERGKSSIISIVDYCLGSSKCQIPTGVIRNKTKWFGVVISHSDGEILLCRRMTEENELSNKMFMLEQKSIELPRKIKGNCSIDNVKYRLNELSLLTNLTFKEEDDDNTGFKGRPSFRDLVSFTFQPQYLVANPRTMFYRADTFEHRERLKVLFPYVLGAVNNDTLALREELTALLNKQKVLEKEIHLFNKAIRKWKSEIRSYYAQAKEYGLLSNMPDDSELWETSTYLDILRKIPPAVEKKGLPSITVGATIVSSERINQLRERELSLAHEIDTLRQRLISLRKINSSNKTFSLATVSQAERVKSVDWFEKKLKSEMTCPFCENESNHIHDYVNTIIDTKNEILSQAGKSNEIRKVFDGEIAKVSNELKTKEDEINSIRKELKSIEKTDLEYRRRTQSSSSVYRFVGNLEGKLRDYDEMLKPDGDMGKLGELEEEIERIRGKIDQEKARKRLENRLKRISSSIGKYAKTFEAERHTDPIQLDLKNLTIRFSQDIRNDFLWEIGSGSNYMAYHLSTILALHEEFSQIKNCPVPNFAFFDQPSQAYFPELGAQKENLDNKDLIRVQRIFKALDQGITATNNDFQVIVLEHAGTNAWKGLESVHLVARWRDDETDHALIPREWLN